MRSHSQKKKISKIEWDHPVYRLISIVRLDFIMAASVDLFSKEADQQNSSKSDLENWFPIFSRTFSEETSRHSSFKTILLQWSEFRSETAYIAYKIALKKIRVFNHDKNPFWTYSTPEDQSLRSFRTPHSDSIYSKVDDAKHINSFRTHPHLDILIETSPTRQRRWQ